ncbi:MAG: ribosomal protein S18-alanine N-acetyltransferase [Leptolyngbyaceae cyanobacterium]
MTHLVIKPLTLDRLTEALALDDLCFGGLWTASGYQREIDSPNSALLILEASGNVLSQTSQPVQLAQPVQTSNQQADIGLPPSTSPPVIGIGCVWFVLEEAHITLLGIDPCYREQGLGTFMLIALLKAALGNRSEWATLEVRQSNHIAQALYKQVGFTVVGQRKHYYPDTKEDALILWHRGLQEPHFLEKLIYLEQQVHRRIQASGWNV